MFKKIASFFGYEIIRKNKSPTLFSHLSVFLEKYNVDLVIDVGANQGQFGCKLRQCGYKGQIISYEPSSVSFNILSKLSVDDGNWNVYKIGLGSECGVMNLNVAASSPFSSILLPNQYGSDIFENIRTTSKELIRIDTLEHQFSKLELHKFKRIFLKIDTQGYDLQVFRGAGTAVQRKIVGLLSEISLISIYEGMPDYKDSLAEFERSGFHITGLYPVSREANLSLIEIDCVMLNRAIC